MDIIFSYGLSETTKFMNSRLLNRKATRATVQAELGDVVYVELPDVGSTVTKGEGFGVVESVKVVTISIPTIPCFC
jgi:hypothetical protein